MNRITTTLGVGISSLALALSIAAPVQAWHPKGGIVKEVQNVTSGSLVVDANSAAQAVSAKPGDTLKYIVTVYNDGDENSQGHNDMVGVSLVDVLPAGVELAGNTAQRTVSYDLGRIKPGERVSREITVKVTGQTDGSLIDNNACFTGDSEVNDAPQRGCDNAIVKVSVPPAPVTPVTPVTPAPVKPAAPAVLPSTGPESTVAGALVSSLAAYGAVIAGRRIRK